MQSNMTVKGQVTVPKPFRDELGLKPGRPVLFVKNAEGEVVVKACPPVDDTERLRLEGEARVAALRIALDELRGSWPTGESVDDFMAYIRPPVPL